MNYDVEVRRSARGRLSAMAAIVSPVHLPSGFCFLVSRASGRPAQPAFDFLTSAYLAGAQVRELICAENTIKAVVDDLSDFHHFLDAHSLWVHDVGEEALEQYLRSMTTLKSPVTGRPYERSTVLRRRSSVTRFLQFCQERGLLRHRFKIESSPTPSGIAQRFAPNLPGPRADPIDKLVRAIEPPLLRPLLDELGPALVNSVDEDLVISPQPSVSRLMAEVCLNTGLRRAEACSLRVEQVVNVHLEGRDPFTSIAISVRGKGRKLRQVPFPVWLLTALRFYAQNVRAHIVSTAIKQNRRLADHGYLFVIEKGCRGVKGRPITPKYFNKIFASARERMLARLMRDDPELHRLAKSIRITIHALRHTFALLTYIQRRNFGDASPGKYVQAVLGHSYQETTERIYLRSSHVFESELSEAMEQLL
ncbi:tyrosine-type recombinase/integrase [Pseudoxanthomonas suwonensis]|uniref:tyrosine-type recombinase/integrase n=1 Tax=Pseudoxanthomonas suwonensis TaxID=314722 RepID=UPI00138F662E|nr:tyrosine-type recombinase/integrase [Pseudoxanthomonas suwonensis]